MASKVVVIGAVNGHIRPVLDKLTSLHSKNTFALAIVTGDLFADPSQSTDADDETLDALLKGSISVPLPTYFTLGSHPFPPAVIEKLSASDGEICDNLYFLGKRTTLTTSEGIKIVALGGRLDPAITAGTSKDSYTPFYTVDDARALRGAHSADLLLTSIWPTSIRLGSKVTVKDGHVEPLAEQSVAELCAVLQPRYHFSTSAEFFYEREPFFHATKDTGSDERRVTRFISLAKFGNKSKQKWIYAFTVDPSAAQPTSLAPGTTASPLAAPSKKRAGTSDLNGSFSRFAATASNHHHRTSKRSRQPPPGPGECFFCLSNPNLATHLITSIADDSYLTTARGPLTTAETYPSLPFPAHILIIPLTHSPSLTAIADSTVRDATSKEMERYRHALTNMVRIQSRDDLGAVTWEVSRAGGIHDHWQFLPVQASLVQKGLVEAAFRVEAENQTYPTFRTHDSEDKEQRGDFFRVWLWSASPASSENVPASKSPREDDGKSRSEEKPTERCLILPLSDSFRFDVQFGRRVMAKLLGLEARMNWKDCLQDEDTEKADAEAFKTAFKPFDFASE
ncbi:MAG: hypothetical protein M1817_002096 [Caeruleum heppii]|nr:MAG: hypothetical protein M1817_002096 [Caeruleum heppii]